MLGLILGTFLNMVWKCGFPSTKPQYYDPLINHSRIALMCTLDMRYEEDVDLLLGKGAEACTSLIGGRYDSTRIPAPGDLHLCGDGAPDDRPPVYL